MQGDGGQPDRTQAGLGDIDRLIHEPARLAILSLLFVIESADFLFVVRQTGLTRGNLSSHVSRLEDAGYVAVEKQFKGKRPHTTLRMTSAGRFAFQEYRAQIETLLAQHPGNNNDNAK
jgi:DNA-binding transcriptional ArsR family regulator